jgi:Zn-finger protein
MNQPDSDLKKYPTIGVCGLDCGLCPRYYTAGPSRCPGCGGPNFLKKHPSCSFITCCVKKNNFEVCADCPNFPCSKFKSEKDIQEYEGSSSYPPYKKIMLNLNYIKEYGIEDFIDTQKKRIRLLEKLIQDFDDGRSRSFFCKATALLDIKSIEDSLIKAIQKIKPEKIRSTDIKIKAKILKDILNETALKEGILLTIK